MERDSALPARLFDCQEPMVEAALIDAAARVFLDKLAQPAAVTRAAPSTLPASEVVDAATMEACLREFRTLADQPPPDLMAGLADERVWVLLDLAHHATGVGRQRATLELRQCLRRLAEQAQDNRALLRDLATELATAVNGGCHPVVFKAFLLEVLAALRHFDDDHRVESSPR